jgi:hypothetical protein
MFADVVLPDAVTDVGDGDGDDVEGVGKGALAARLGTTRLIIPGIIVVIVRE